MKPQEKGQDVPAYTALGEAAAAAITDRYTAWRAGEEPIMGCCGGGNENAASVALNDMIGFATNGAVPQVAVSSVQSSTIRMEFIGGQMGAQTFYGKGSGLPYRAGREQSARFHDVDPRDVEHFVNSGMFRVVEAIDNAVEEQLSTAQEPRTIPSDRPRPKGRRAPA